MFQVADGLMVVVGFLVAWWLKFHSGLLTYGGHLPFDAYLPVIVLMAPVFVLLNSILGLYQPMRVQKLTREIRVLTEATAVMLLVFLSVLYMLKLAGFSRDVLALYAGVCLVFLLTERIALRLALRTLRSHRLNQRYILLVGWNASMHRFLHGLEQYPWFGYQVLGVVPTPGDDTSPPAGLPIVGRMEELSQVLRHHTVDHVVISLPRATPELMTWVIQQCDLQGIQSLIVPDYIDILPARPRFETFGDMPLIDTRYVPLDDATNAALKRTFDIAFSALALAVLSPLLVLVALGIKLTSPGPVIYRQERVGRNRRTFTMYKFRTMRPDADALGNGWTVPNDQRRTRLGALIRRTSIDELPQFWNVLIGDMSVIGPRPEQPKFVDQFSTEIPHYMLKHRVRPGITGWAQVNGWRGDSSIPERIRYDLEYIEDWSFWLDLRIIGKTLRTGLVHPNAY